LEEAIVETASSGKEVPMATMVSPTMSGEILKEEEIFSAILTRYLVDTKSNISPKANLNIKTGMIYYSMLSGLEINMTFTDL